MKTNIRRLIGIGVTLALCLTMLLPACVPVLAQDGEQINVTSYGTPIVCCADPKGQGNKDIHVICDGVFPEVSGTGEQQYDTWGSTPHEGNCYFGMKFDRALELTGFVYQTGMHFPDGGWFVSEGLTLQIRQNGEWVDAADYTVSPAVPVNTATDDREGSFACYTFTFQQTVKADGVRISGAAAGHTSCAEIAVYATDAPEPVEDVNVTSYGTPIVCCADPKGQGNKDIHVICDGVFPEVSGTGEQQYDTWGSTPHEGNCYFGMKFDRALELTRFVYQTGMHFPDGGWFVSEGLTLQIRQNGEWVDAADYTVSPAVPVNTATDDREGSFASYTFTLPTALKADGVRISGAAAGHTSCAEIAVYAAEVPVEPVRDVNITSLGAPIVCCADPKGAGNKDIHVICDGVFPGASGTGDQQYDTWGSTPHEGNCYFGMEFPGICDFTRFVYQTGVHYPDGGWFVGDSIRLEVKQDDRWIEMDPANYTVTPAIPSSTAGDDREGSFASYTFAFFSSVEGSGIRVTGQPAGHTSCAELAVWAEREPITDQTPVDITEYATAVCCKTGSHTGAGSSNIGVITDGFILSEETAANGTWYDTYGEAEHDGDCYFGLEYEKKARFTSLYFQTGRHFGDGGWFVGDTVRVQVKKDDMWVDVNYTVSPAIPSSTATEDKEGSFAEYTFTLDGYETGTGIRVIGEPGGHASCGEIAARGFGYREDFIDYEGKLTHDGLLDRIQGARLAEAVGYLWGQKLSGVYTTTMVEGALPAAPANLSGMYSVEDIYGEIPFLKAYASNLDSTIDDLAAQFAASEAGYTHAARQAMTNLKAGLSASEAGDARNNQHYNDYNWAALSNFYGLMYPGNVNLAAEKAFEAGHIMGCGDGAYAGAFLAALQAAAFSCDNVTNAVDRAIEVIPAGSDFGTMLREVRELSSRAEAMEDVYDLIYLGWAEWESCPEHLGEAETTVFTNAAFVLSALLIGNGDFKATAEAVIRAGMLSGSTASSALSILGAMQGYEKMGSKYKKALAAAAGTYSGSDWDFDALVHQNFTLAESNLQKQGLVYDEANGWQIALQEARVLPLEESQNLPVLVLSSRLADNKTVILTANAYSLSFTRIESYDWDFGDGTTGDEASPEHRYADYGAYTVRCTVTDREGKARTEQCQVNVLPLLHDHDEIITTATAPQGLGSKDLSILCDGIYVNGEDESVGYSDQYDSYGAQPDENGDTWFGYRYQYQHTFQGLIFQEGVHDSTGGFIQNGTMKVQVLTDEGWVDVTGMKISPEYPNSADYRAFGKNFEIFHISFDALNGHAIRLVGTGGFFGLAELTACGVLNMSDEEKVTDVSEKIAGLPDVSAIAARHVEAVRAARAAYDALSDEGKAQIEHLERLTAAEAKIAECTDQAGKVDEMILALPALDSITKDDKEAVGKARAAYDALSEGAKTFITQLPVLEKAEQKVRDLEITYGDIDHDGRVDASDALLALQHSVELVTLKDAEFTAADVDLNGVVDASDALLILQYSVGLIHHLPHTK